MKTISSPTNQTIKDLVRLKDRKGEWALKSFLVEGAREISRAIKSGFELECLYICPELFSDNDPMIAGISIEQKVLISPEAFSKIAVREHSDGILGVFAAKESGLEDLDRLVVTHQNSGKKLLILALEEVEKPGNLGAVLRSADGAGVSAVVTVGRKVDFWNQNVIRASLGAVFSVPVVALSNIEFKKWCEINSIETIGAALSPKSIDVFQAVLSQSTAVVFGTEANGLSQFWLQQCSKLIKIPMLGICDSLNVSVAASIVSYEALRQREL